MDENLYFVPHSCGFTNELNDYQRKAKKEKRNLIDLQIRLSNLLLDWIPRENLRPMKKRQVS